MLARFAGGWAEQKRQTRLVGGLKFLDAKFGVPTGIRTPVASVKGRCPRPLDDGNEA